MKFTPECVSGLSEDFRCLQVDLKRDDAAAVNNQKFEKLLPAVVLVQPVDKWSAVYAIGVVTGPDLGLMADQVNAWDRRGLEDGGFKRSLNGGFLEQGILQVANAIFHPGREDGIGRDDFTKSLVERGGNARANAEDALQAQAFEKEITPGIRLRVTIFQHAGRPQRDANFPVGDDMDLDLGCVAIVIEHDVHRRRHAKAVLRQMTEHGRQIVGQPSRQVLLILAVVKVHAIDLYLHELRGFGG